MRALPLLIAVTGCGFTVPVHIDDVKIDAPAGGSGDEAGAVVIDGPPGTIDAAIDAMPMIDAAIDAPPAHDCGPSYVAVANSGTTSKYRKVNQLTMWPAAKQTCATDTAYLVIPETVAEGAAVYAFVNPAGSSPYYWAGIEDTNNDNVWTTVLGAAFPNPPFQSGQPTNNSGEIYILVGSNGRFYDFLSNATQEFACECAP